MASPSETAGVERLRRRETLREKQPLYMQAGGGAHRPLTHELLRHASSAAQALPLV